MPHKLHPVCHWYHLTLQNEAFSTFLQPNHIRWIETIPQQEYYLKCLLRTSGWFGRMWTSYVRWVGWSSVSLRIRCLAKEKWATFGGVRTSGLGKLVVGLHAKFACFYSCKNTWKQFTFSCYLETNEYSSANNRRIWEQESAVEAFLRVFKSLTRIFIPVLKVLLVDLRRLAAQVIMYQLFPCWYLHCSWTGFCAGGPYASAKWKCRRRQ